LLEGTQFRKTRGMLLHTTVTW